MTTTWQFAAEGRRPKLLVIGPGYRKYREYLLRSLAGAYRVHLLSPVEPTWEGEYAEHTTVLVESDPDSMLDAARRIDAADPIAGVLCWDETKIIAAAHVAAGLGLPGGQVEAMEHCRDKSLTRTALAGTAVAQPASMLVATVDEALARAEEIGYPVVLKPRAAATSWGVVLARTPAEVRGAFELSNTATIAGARRYDASVLVEEYVTGPEISVDSTVFRGEVTPVVVARKEVGYEPYFEEVGHTVDANDPLLVDPALRAALTEAHAAIGFTDGWTHAEFRLTPNGPKLIEVNGRLGGGLIPYLGQLASGVDAGLAAAAVACGTAPDLARPLARHSAIRFFYVDSDNRVVESVDFDHDALHPAVDLAVPLAEPGAVLSPPPKVLFPRLAMATAVADTAEECRQALDSAAAALLARFREGGATAAA